MAGRRIDDHSSPFGKAEAGEVFPDGGHHLKMERDDGHAGHLEDYEDTTEKIESVQTEGVRKVESKKMKPGFRN